MPVSGHKARKLDITNGTKKVTRKLEIFPGAGAGVGSLWEFSSGGFWFFSGMEPRLAAGCEEGAEGRGLRRGRGGDRQLVSRQH